MQDKKIKTDDKTIKSQTTKTMIKHQNTKMIKLTLCPISMVSHRRRNRHLGQMSVHMFLKKKDERLMKDMKIPRAQIMKNKQNIIHSIKKRCHDDVYAIKN